MNSKKELSIIINSYKTPALLDLCINSIQKNIGKIEYEIIVSDGETGAETKELMSDKHPEIKFISHQKNVGFANLVNRGIKASCGDYLFIINADIVIKNNAIEKLINYLKEDKEIGMIGPKLINFDNSVQQSCFRFYTPLTVIYRRTFFGKFSFAKKHLGEFNMKKEQKKGSPLNVDWLMGSAMMLPREVVDKIGPMDNRYFMYFEDTDWCWEVWKRGYKVVYYPEATAYHYHGKASSSKGGILKSLFMNKYTRIHIASAIKFFFKHLKDKNPHFKYNQKNKIK